MNHIPTDDQIRKDADFLGYSKRNTDRLIAHARRARSGSTNLDGFKATHGAGGGGSPSGISDPTGEMACNDERTTPEVEKQHAFLFDMLTQGAASKRASLNTMDAIEDHQTPHAHRTVDPPACSVKGCDTKATKNGMCDTDNRFNLRWVEEHNEPAPIGVLEANAAKRNPKRQRVA